MKFWDLFKTGRRPVEPPPAPQVAAAVDGPSALIAVARLEARLETVESGLRLVRLEWAEALDKVEHQLGRHAKRLRDAQKAERDAEGGEVAPPPPEAAQTRLQRKEALRASLTRRA